MGPGLEGTFDTPSFPAEAGVEDVADHPMDDRPFDIRAEQGTLASIRYTVELDDIPTMLLRRNSGGLRA